MITLLIFVFFIFLMIFLTFKGSSKKSNEAFTHQQNKFQISESIFFDYTKLRDAGNDLMRIYYAIIIFIIVSLISFLIVFYLTIKGEIEDLTIIYYVIGAIQILFLIVILISLKSASENLINSVTYKVNSNLFNSNVNNINIMSKLYTCPKCAAEFKNILVEHCPRCGQKLI